MRTYREYKREAKASLNGFWTKGVVATIIYLVIASGVELLVTTPLPQNTGTGVSLLWALVCLPLAWGYEVFFLRILRREDTSYSRLFDGYSDIGRIFGTMLLQGLYIFLWSLLLLVPGIIKSFSYAMTPYILRDNPEMRFNEAIEESMRMMQGHKAELFMLFLSFLGWAVLSVLTLGLGFLLLMPYVYTAVGHFYEDLKGE